MEGELQPRIKMEPGDPVVDEGVRYEAVYPFSSDAKGYEADQLHHLWAIYDSEDEKVTHGGGAKADTHVFTHTYEKSGRYRVEVAVHTPDGGNKGHKAITPFIKESGNEPPEPRIQINPPTATVGEQVTFDGSNSFDPDGSIISYTWRVFGPQERGRGPRVFEKKGKRISKPFYERGSYTVGLSVEDDQHERWYREKGFRVMPGSEADTKEDQE